MNYIRNLNYNRLIYILLYIQKDYEIHLYSSDLIIIEFWNSSKFNNLNSFFIFSYAQKVENNNINYIRW